MDHMVGISMKMSLHWGWNISFVFEQFTVLEDETFLIIIGMIITLLISILSIAMPSLKSSLIDKLFPKEKSSSLLVRQADDEEDEEKSEKSTKELLFNFIYIFLYSVMHILTMMLLMTYNGYVVIVVVLGLTIGYTIFGMEVDKDKNIPVNCCA